MALTKISRGLLDTGVSDSSDATAITIDSSENVTIGTVAAGASTATPVELNLGSTFADAAGSKSKMKLKVFEDTSSNILGLGVSAGTLELHSNQTFTFLVDESEKMRLDSSGRLLLGTTTEGRAGEGADMFTIGDTSNNSGMTMRSGTSGYGSIYFSDATSGTGEYAGYVQYAHNGDMLLLATGSNTRIRIDSDGLKFGSDSAAANALDDYEEGDFTPTFATAGGSAPSSQTGTGQYTKIGDVVHFTGQISWSGSGSGGSNLRIALPFTPISDARGGLAIGLNSGVSFTSGHTLHLIPELNSALVYVVSSPDNGGAHDHLNFSNVTASGSSIFSFAGTVHVQ